MRAKKEIINDVQPNPHKGLNRVRFDYKQKVWSTFKIDKFQVNIP